MKLYSIHLWLVATVRDRAGRRREEPISRRLVVQAVDPQAARVRAILWLETEASGPVSHLTFAAGARDAVAVRLADCREPVGVYPADGDVVPL